MATELLMPKLGLTMTEGTIDEWKKKEGDPVQKGEIIYSVATDKLTNYCAAKYCGVGNDTMENQMEDYLFVAEETSAYFLGNALALLDPASREAEIKTFVENLRRIAGFAQQKMDRDQKLN